MFPSHYSQPLRELPPPLVPSTQEVPKPPPVRIRPYNLLANSILMAGSKKEYMKEISLNKENTKY